MNRPLLIHHANLLSPAGGTERGDDALWIESGMIRAIGRYEDLRSAVHAGVMEIDAGGKTLMPGLNDSHIHIWKAGNLMTFLPDLRSAGSMDEMLSLLGDYAARYPESAGWVLARGFNEAAWPEGKMPGAADLDRVIADRPVCVTRTCAHIIVANTRAMQMAGVDARTPVPAGGAIDRGSDGRPNGVFRDGAMGLITAQIPPYSKAELKTMIGAACGEMARLGITAATDPAVDPLLLETYQDMAAAGELSLRLNAIPILLPDGGQEAFPVPDYFSSPWLTVNAVKFFSDGGLSSRTAALKRPYKNSGGSGLLRLTPELFLRLGTAAMEKGLGVATHAIGDAAIDLVLSVYKELHARFPASLKRIEHLGLPEPQHLRQMAEYGIAASMQTIFIDELGRNFLRDLDEEYLDNCYPVRSVRAAGVLTALSSDAPVVRNFNPFKGMEAAITRRTAEGLPIGPAEAIDTTAALQAYTSDAATIGRNPQIGALARGKQADLILLNQDPRQVNPEDLSQVKVEMTIIGGKTVWRRE